MSEEEQVTGKRPVEQAAIDAEKDAIVLVEVDGGKEGEAIKEEIRELLGLGPDVDLVLVRAVQS
jgi:hypothetical protein